MKNIVEDGKKRKLEDIIGSAYLTSFVASVVTPAILGYHQAKGESVNAEFLHQYGPMIASGAVALSAYRILNNNKDKNEYTPGVFALSVAVCTGVSGWITAGSYTAGAALGYFFG